MALVPSIYPKPGLRHKRGITPDNAPLMTRYGCQVQLEWPSQVVIAFDRGGEIEIGQFTSTKTVTRHEVQARVMQALVGDHNP